MRQDPATGDFLLRWRGDVLTVTLRLAVPRAGRAAFRTNLGNAHIRRQEIIDETERGETPLARAWSDWPLTECEPGVFQGEIPLDEVGYFSGKACFFPAGSSVPEWPEGPNTHIKVESAASRSGNAIYCVFPRQFGSFREVIRRLPLVMDTMGFRIVQTLPPFPVPTTYAVMGEYGCPFAATDFFSVDPAMAEFDESATPLDQFRELIDAVHARAGRFLIDLPANHTGWASALQTHHPEWFRRTDGGRFVSPGAWGVTWADLVSLDYTHAALRAYMADVFLFWCRNGVDGFRCDAGYMIPLQTWSYIVARVREEFPDTVFLLEGLGGAVETTDALLSEGNLDWAYSEIFQTYDRGAFEWYLPRAIARAEKYGTLVHFAETHDNDRLAKGGEVYARLRVQLAALLSWQGAWGIANGVEWFCREKIDVHGKNDLSWGSTPNMVPLIARLNALLSRHASFSGGTHLRVVTRGSGNTLAVVREGLLVLANLDCQNVTAIDWDRTAFAGGVCRDLLTERTVEASQPISLAPGEVLCLESASTSEETRIASVEESRQHPAAFAHWVYPRDLKREVVVPAHQTLCVQAEHAFRFQLIDPVTGRTLCTGDASQGAAWLTMPDYAGDGSACRELDLFLMVFAPGKSTRTHARVLIPPSSHEARVMLRLRGETVRARPNDRAILSNGAGAVAQVRAGWGAIASQYDALLSANPNADVPGDRVNVWARTRCWLQREGYTRAFDARTVTAFAADPAGRGVRWLFRMPCGMGRVAAFAFDLTLADGQNAARLKVTRIKAGSDDVGDSVRIVFRPDIECRSYHAKTKAYAGAETLFPKSCRTTSSGFVFEPYETPIEMRVEGGVYHPEAEWTYNVQHPEEAERGQEGAGDLFSPGWISADLKVGARVSMVGSYGNIRAPQWRLEDFPQTESLPIPLALKQAMDLFIVRRDDLKTVIAGYPWFLDWGRDTFIFLRGMLTAGRIADSLAILRAFAAFEDRGTLPNIIYGTHAGNRDTTDAPLWFIRCVSEIEPFVGAAEAATLKKTCVSIVDHYIAGTPNGIHVDAESGLVWSPAHFTWMDTNYPACTPRVGYPVEIQALWISALAYLGRAEEAERTRASVKRLFKAPVGYCDCLSAPDGESAAKARPEDTIRPNQLFLITLGAVEDASILDATEALLVPGGIRTLQPEHPLYRGVYAGDEDSSRKPAYHNGTVWAWPFPLYAEALVRMRRCSRETALQLLAGSVENINRGCLCHMSETADGDAPHRQKGCCAQAWSDSELLRVWLALSRESLK